ncbi:hypothetical protein HK104_009452 [Borealophlyctis nickersoniae]|nr:hypothetical protein HK104_009452 [Borealophlyctis nickersoniae]
MPTTNHFLTLYLIALCLIAPVASSHLDRRILAKTTPEAKIQEWMTIGKVVPTTSQVVIPLIKELKPVSKEFMYGVWHGGTFLGPLIYPVNWYGKRFTPTKVDPMLLRRPATGTIYSFKVLGLGKLGERTYENTTSAALLYDDNDIVDIFRRVNASAVAGIAFVPGGEQLAFWLTRVEGSVDIED